MISLPLGLFLPVDRRFVTALRRPPTVAGWTKEPGYRLRVDFRRR